MHFISIISVKKTSVKRDPKAKKQLIQPRWRVWFRMQRNSAGRNVVCGCMKTTWKRKSVQSRRVSKKRKRDHQKINSMKKRYKPPEKLLEYARSKGNEKLSLVLSKSTDLLQEMVQSSKPEASHNSGFLWKIMWHDCDTWRKCKMYIMKHRCCFEKWERLVKHLRWPRTISNVVFIG